MTEIEETIKSLKEMFPKGLCEVNEYKMAQVAINALEKQIPKKPIFTEDKQFALCPYCDGKGLFDKQKHCDNCGQAIDWSDEE